ncbi:MAG TPA: DUF6518 family protein [Galbitalea sp.]|nr:DUF6518 family protein [Galbitalea sp.]
MTASSAESARSSTTSSVRLRVLIVLLVAALAGALTPLGEHILPESINSAANSSGPWATIAFALVYASQLRGWAAAALAAAALVIMDLTFFLFFDGLGGYYPHHYLAFWIAIAICVGPLLGLCASWLRSPNERLQELGVAAPSAVLIGEGVYMLEWLPGVSVVYSIASLVVGAALFGVLAVALLRQPARMAASFVLCAAGSFLFLEIYGLLPLVLNKVVP